MFLLLNKIINNFILSSTINGDQPLSYAIKNIDLSAIKKTNSFYQMMLILIKKLLLGREEKKKWLNRHI